MITYDDTKDFNGQTEEVKNYIRTEVIDQSATPVTRDNLGRPLDFLFAFTDAKPQNYSVAMRNVYISNRSWALREQIITVEKQQ